MQPDKLPELPTWVQAALSGGLFLATMAIAVLGWIKKNVSGGLLGEKETSSEKAVVLSAAIADSKSIAKLADAIELLCVQIKRNDAEDRDDLDRLRRDHRDLIDSMDRLTRAINAKGLVL